MKLFNPENAHWYRRDGEPLHSVLAANGSLQTATMRPTTVRDARKLGLLPSVTNVLGVINKPELVEWKMTQAVLAALTLPRGNGEELGVFAKRVVEDAQSQVRGAAEFGTAFHAGAERVAKSLEVDQAGPYAAWLNLYRDWFQANCVRVVWTERVLVNAELGYAGTADLLVEHQAYGLTLVDYKTQVFRKKGNGLLSPPLSSGGGEGDGRERAKVRAGERGSGEPGKPRAYNSWCQQLAAYRRAIGKPVACMNLIVNSAEPSPPVEHVWRDEELRTGLQSFGAALVIWRHEKNYDPRSWRTATGLPHEAPGGGPPEKKGQGACPLGAVVCDDLARRDAGGCGECWAGVLQGTGGNNLRSEI